MVVALLFRLLLLLSCLLVLLPLTFSASESEALFKLKKSFVNASALDSWMPNSEPCDKQASWDGLLCNKKGNITGLRLEGMGLSGKIDVDALFEMKNLRSLSVMNNSFTGTIPEINRLGALKALFLSGNQFSGEILDDFFAKMESLKKVWLSDNKFQGEIPSSLALLSNLMDLHLENNEFEGEIPSGLSSKFNVKSFAGNPGLCGQKIGVECRKESDQGPPQASSVSTPAAADDDDGFDKSDFNKTIAAMIILGVMLLVAVLILAIRWRKRNHHDPNMTRRLSSNEVVEVQVSVQPAGARREVEVSSHDHVTAGAIPAELVMVNEEKGVFGLPDLMKSAAEMLGNGAAGSSYRVVMANGVSVVVKRMKEMSALGRDEFGEVVKRLGKLRHPNVLTPLAYHYRKEEKLFVYEYIPNGSLLYQLHGDHGESSADQILDWPARLKIVQGIAAGLDNLYTELASFDVPHGNLKSSNVLLGPDNHPYLSDYGYCPLVSIDVEVEALFVSKTPEAIQHGTLSPKSDVYCLGIVILEILTGKFPCQYFSDETECGTDMVQLVSSAFSEGRQAELLDPQVVCSCQNSLGSVEKLLHIAVLCTQTSPEQRLGMKEAIIMIEQIKVEGGAAVES